MPIFENAKKKINNLTKKLLTFENQGDIICTSNGLRTAHGISFQHNTNYVGYNFRKISVQLEKTSGKRRFEKWSLKKR